MRVLPSLLCLCAVCNAATIPVDLNGTEYTEIQPAIDAAVEGDTVLVGPGEYIITSPISFNGKAITVKGEAGAEQTTIRMSPTPADPDRASVVIFENGEASEAILQGFTLTGGKGSKTDDMGIDNSGGGVFCSFGSSPTISHCILTQNEAAFGGGVFCSNAASPTLTELRITENSAGEGGGICCWTTPDSDDDAPDVSPVISGCTITRNSAINAGGGLSAGIDCSLTITDCKISDNTVFGRKGGYNSGGGICILYPRDTSHTTITGCTISGNSVPRHGGGIELDYCSVTITNCLISGNSANDIYHDTNDPLLGAGAGIFCSGHADIEITNCTIAGNLATSAAGGVYAWGKNPTLRITNSIIWDNVGGSIHLEEGVTALLDFNCIEGDDIFPGERNINKDPMFHAWGDEADVTVQTQADLEAALSGYSFDFAVTSPCVGAGRDGTDMGADGDRHPEPGYTARKILLGSGTFDINGLDLRHNVSIAGAGPEESIIDGTIYGLRTNQSLSGVTVTKGRSGGVVISRGEAPEIASCAITRNTIADEFKAYHAGGITCNARSSPTIRDCLISMNVGAFGGISCGDGSSLLISNCTISQNDDYGIVCGDESTCDIRDCRITGNQASGVWFYLSPARLTNCVVAGNHDSGVRCSRSPMEITNCVIAGNGRNGVACENNPSGDTNWAIAVTNCTLVSNRSTDLYGSTTLHPVVSNCIIGRTVNVLEDSLTSCCTIQSPFPGEGNLNENPLFVFDGIYDFQQNEEIEINGTMYEFPNYIVTPGDFHLQSNSPCINAGTSTDAPETDIEGNQRPCGGGIDMGAYESGRCGLLTGMFQRGDTNADNTLDIADAIFTLTYLFASGPAPSCLDAADANDDGAVDIADAIAVLSHLFGSVGPLPAPFGECSIDPTVDELDCASFAPCE